MAVVRLPCPVEGHECTETLIRLRELLIIIATTKGTWNWEGEGVRGSPDWREVR